MSELTAKQLACEKTKRWRAKNPDKAKAITKAWKLANREYDLKRMRVYHYQTKYRITIEEYDALAAAQNGLCALCGKADKRGRLAIDHCHSTGRVRGLLCRTCNVGLGYVERLSERLPQLLAYLGRRVANDS